MSGIFSEHYEKVRYWRPVCPFSRLSTRCPLQCYPTYMLQFAYTAATDLCECAYTLIYMYLSTHLYLCLSSMCSCMLRHRLVPVFVPTTSLLCLCVCLPIRSGYIDGRIHAYKQETQARAACLRKQQARLYLLAF